MKGSRVVLMAVLLGAMLVLPAASRGDDDAASAGDDHCGPQLQEWSLRFAGGVNPENVIQYYALHADLGFRLWQSADRWFTAHDMTARWVVEPWTAYVVDHHGIHQTSSFEIGVSPLFGKLTFTDWRLRPFIEGGEGLVYTDLRKQRLGTRVQFASTAGFGLEYEIRPDLSLSFAIRIRHISNAGLASTNPGITTYMGLVGLTFR